MDKTPEFIEMCEKATELQEMRPVGSLWEEGDYYCFSYEGEFVHLLELDCFCDSESHARHRHPGDIWLPRQDQLQGMLADVDAYPQFAPGATYGRNLRDLVIKFTEASSDESYWQFTSMEQLWLAFVMQEKYGKHWTGEEWVSA